MDSPDAYEHQCQEADLGLHSSAPGGVQTPTPGGLPTPPADVSSYIIVSILAKHSLSASTVPSDSLVVTSVPTQGTALVSTTELKDPMEGVEASLREGAMGGSSSAGSEHGTSEHDEGCSDQEGSSSSDGEGNTSQPDVSVAPQSTKPRRRRSNRHPTYFRWIYSN